MWGGGSIYRYVGSVLPEHRGKGATHMPPVEIVNETNSAVTPADPRTKDTVFTETYMMIVIFLSTLLPLMCVILSAVLARKLWVKFHDQPSPTVEREDTGQTSIKSTREHSSSRKSSRGGSRASKSDPNSRDQLLPQEAAIDVQLEDPIIVVADEDGIAGTSQDNSTTIEIEDDGGFGSARSKFRNHSLKVDVEGSPHRSNHHRSYSDAGRSRKKVAEPQPAEQSKDAEKPSRSSNLLSAPGTKIRKSHSMRYRSDASPTGTRPRVQAQDDCMGNLKRASLEPEILVTSPRLQQRRSPHHFYQQQHHPQVHHQQSHKSHHQHHYKQHHRQEEPDAQLTQMPDDVIVQAEQPIEQTELDTENFGIPPSDVNMEDNNPANPSYKYGNQPPNKYPPLNKVLYYGGYYGYPPATSTGYTASSEMRPRRLHVSSHQSSGASPPEGDKENKEKTDRKKSLPNAFDFPPPEIRPMPVLSPRGLLSKQFSLPAAARNPRQLKGSHQRHHASLRHDPAPQRLLEAPTLTRRASARERTSSGGFVARRTASGGGERSLGRTSGSFNLGTISPRSPIPPNHGGSVSPRSHLSVNRPGPSPSPHHVQDDEIQHI